MSSTAPYEPFVPTVRNCHTMNTPDTRWLQRLENCTNALSELTDAVRTRSDRPLSRLEAMGLIQVFEFTYELGWSY